ncbi:hypothetical protein OVY01_20640 [Robbsia sp. Bb-Pol-6]|uniref:Prolyl 4-hydroxylase alpha subunit Fe(2+) 2OG dioxygenase domain-containing protein n=1 Tax=Robbsia betulipollinis TaxID=2981849 RepID=A0ABT3ZSY7_9BURK|nr:hypothetical protein [Robbsia betulipollinis]MCY0389557.1 hypothetical protein [Robbsia betulipollinis]
MMPFQTHPHDPLPSLSAEQIARLQESIDTVGMGVWRDAVSPAFLDAARSFIGQQLDEHDHQYFSLHGERWLAASPLKAIAESTALRQTVDTLGKHVMAGRTIKMNMAASMRVLTGELGQRHSERYHYDSYVVTVLVPLIMPDVPGEPHGDLVLFPNLRGVPGSAMLNIVEKLCVENGLVRALWRQPRVQRWFGAKVMKMTPGNLYFFWGIRSLHANQACAVGRVRGTALFHFGDPHAGGVLKRLSGAHHRFKQQRLARRASVKIPTADL